MGEESDERRREVRHSVNIEVDYQSAGTFLFAYITDISTMGIFVRTPNPPVVGTVLKLRFRPPVPASETSATPKADERHTGGPRASSEPIELYGVVKWNTLSGGDSDNPGMGVQFKDIAADQRSRLMDLIHAIAYIDDSSG
jgi:type IV pilus assembly protein PilZ